MYGYFLLKIESKNFEPFFSAMFNEGGIIKRRPANISALCFRRTSVSRSLIMHCAIHSYVATECSHILSGARLTDKHLTDSADWQHFT